MLDLLYILLAGIIVLAVGLPIVTLFDKWKKEMETDERKEGENETN